MCNFQIVAFWAVKWKVPVFDKCLEDWETQKPEELNRKFHMKYPFLKNLDMTNICLAGGFCRSILLGQKMKDF